MDRGSWRAGNMLPATRLNPAYVDVNPGTYAISEEGNWVCRAGRDGRMLPHITFDPFSKQWMYVLAEGAYGLLHASGWTGNRIVFTGPITMIGVDCELGLRRRVAFHARDPSHGPPPPPARRNPELTGTAPRRR